MNLIRGGARRAGGESPLAPVGRYLFGPSLAPEPDPDALLVEIDRLGGLVAPADVMRVTGLSRAESEARLCALASRHGGDVGVLGTAVLYRFPRLLRHSPQLIARRATPPAVWDQWRHPEPLTGNAPAVDFALLLSNLLVLAGSVLSVLLTLPASPWIPALAVFVFTLALFTLCLPASRLLNRHAYLARLAADDGRRGLLRAVLQRRPGAALSAHALSHAWVAAAGSAISPDCLREEVVALGGEPDADAEGRLHFRFPDLDHEARALAQLRR